jgi:hypothetical protein
MNYKLYLDYLAERFQTIITAQNTTIIDTEEFGWTNHRYKADSFRMAHIERYTDAKVNVLHVTTFPNQWSPEPIFGFDIITNQNMVIGAYMDFSPGLKTYNFTEGITFEDRKPIPEWATVFSDQFLTLKPKDDDEFMRFCDWAIQKYEWYLGILAEKHMVEWEEEHQVIQLQNNYCKVQSTNPRTFNVLKAKIGEARAKYFMEEILFPQISIERKTIARDVTELYKLLGIL